MTDTAMKRYAMLNQASFHPLLFQPDGSVDADDRALLLRIYGGNTLSSAVLSAIHSHAITGRFDTGSAALLLGLEGGYRVILEDGSQLQLTGSSDRGITGRFDIDYAITGRLA